MSDWLIKQIEISGGFLAGLSLDLPPGLICVIGPRGSGKSTLVEAVRFGICGSAGASRSRMDLMSATLGPPTHINIKTATSSGDDGYTIGRSLKSSATLLGTDGRSVNTIDLDRGTFLPLDAYSSSEIEGIADESVGIKRRSLIDELRADDLQRISVKLSDNRRALEANADKIKASQRLVSDLTERIEEIGDVSARLAGLPKSPKESKASELRRANQQFHANQAEAGSLEEAADALSGFTEQLDEIVSELTDGPVGEMVVEGSANAEVVKALAKTINIEIEKAINSIETASRGLGAAHERILEVLSELEQRHAGQNADLQRLSAVNFAATAAVKERTDLEQQVANRNQLLTKRAAAIAELNKLKSERKALKGKYLIEKDKISEIREQVAEELQKASGDKIRIRVTRNSDNLRYQQSLAEGLRGAKVRGQEAIVTSLLSMRPEELSQLIQDDDVAQFEALTGLGSERSAKVITALRENLDPLELEVTPIEDRIRIELDVSTNGEPNFKEASELSRGQKCTALLPLLMARRLTPLIIDQPEDNLDNHFIYETVVESIRRLKNRRQMIFITHNANIPVLGEADMVVVMNSDGKQGFVEKVGNLDECRDEIIDLLEGGSEAFERRRQRYEKVR